MFVTVRRALLVLALLLTFFGVGVRSARAQKFTNAQVQQMLKIRLMQANALNGYIQRLSASPLAQVQGSAVQSTLALYQTALANVQYQINQLQLLNNAVNLAYAVDALIQNPQNQGNLANLQYSLSTIQYQISTVQATIVVP
jgi:hypothetical protein